MPSDFELYKEWKTQRSHLSMAAAALYLADEFSLNEDSVRSRLSRASRNPQILQRMYQVYRETVSPIPQSVQRQKDLLGVSQDDWQEFQAEDRERLALFVSDAHLPHMRNDAYQLLLQISSDIKPDLISACNDAVDNKGWGVHADDDAIYEQVWRQEFQNTINMQSAYHTSLRLTLASEGRLVQIQGNHDNWLYKYWRTHTKQNAEKLIADYMTHLYYEDDIILFSRGLDENSLHLSGGLVWTHGLTTAGLLTTRAKRGFSRYSTDGRYKSWVQGHTHRTGIISGDSLGYQGVWFANSGHLRNIDVRYMKQKATAWRMGIVICTYNPHKWEHDVNLVEFVKREDKLIAKYDGTAYDVPFGDNRPEYML